MTSKTVSAAPMVYIVDDDSSVRAALEDLLASVGLQAVSFPSTQGFIDYPRAAVPSCLVLDVRMPGQSGMDFHRHINELAIKIPVIFITGHGDIAMSVEAMKNGAIEFLTKPFRDQVLLEAIQRGIAQDAERREHEAIESCLDARWNSLTDSEQNIINLVVEGQLNKQIAAQLNMSEITVKVQRAKAMRKLDVNSLIELVKMTEKLHSK